MAATARFLLVILGVIMLVTRSSAQDISPVAKHRVWLPMTGYNDADVDDARASGYDTVLLKAHPPKTDSGVDFAALDAEVGKITGKGMHVMLAILGWVGLGDGKFWDTDSAGNKIPNQLDPFWPEAMQALEDYDSAVIDHYKSDPKVIAFAPTWGIYGEAGFTSWEAGRSEHALARFNEWRRESKLPELQALPDRRIGPNTEFNRFIRFRYVYMEQRFDEMFRRMKQRAGAVPVGTWQEMYPVIGYLWNMVEVPSADFAMYESAFPFQTNHHPEKSLGETMGFRYRCASASDYRDYYLPLLARKRGEGQRFMGCQLTEDYAVSNYGWTEDKARESGFRKWEDDFGPVLKKLLDEPLEAPTRDVLLVFPTYAAAALSDSPVHFADTVIIDVLLRSYGCQMERYGSARLDKMTVEDMNRFRLIIVPEAAYLMQSTLRNLARTKALVVFTGSFVQAIEGQQAQLGEARKLDVALLKYIERPEGDVSVVESCELTNGLAAVLQMRPVHLPKDESFRYDYAPKSIKVLIKCGDEPVVSRSGSRAIFIHGHLFAGACYNPDRKPPQLSGSKDGSANEVDMWGPYDSSSPQNSFTLTLMKNILDYARVDYRVPSPKPRTVVPYLGDHMEQVSISANLAYNNTAEPQTLKVRLPYRPKDYTAKPVGDRYEVDVAVPPFSYVALER